MKYLIPVIIWIGLLTLIGYSIDMRWGSPYGWVIPMAFFTLSLRELSKTLQEIGEDNKENSAPRVSDAPHTRDTPHKDNYNITQEDIEGDLHEGRD